jgi:hypothetical protein
VTVVSSAITNLVNGVSQQPDSIRLPSQCSVQDNFYPTVVKGLSKRPPLIHLGRMGNSITEAYTHLINRDAVEQYQVVISNGDILVYDLLGNRRTVTFPNGRAYLTSTAPNSDFKALTVADYTFVLNRSVVVAADLTSTSPTYSKRALLYVKQGAYGTKYTVSITVGATVYQYTYQSADGGVASDSQTVDMSHILDALVTGLQAVAGFTTNFTVTKNGSVALLTYIGTGSPDFKISTSDGLANQGLFGIKDQIQHFNDLPGQAIDGFWVKVLGDPSNNFDDYYVIYQDPNGSSTSGSWKETTGQGLVTAFNAATMPWSLIRNSDGTFTFTTIPWKPMTVGDAISSPGPSFVGRTINDVFFHRDRLGFLSGENVSMSKVGDFFNFWPDTATDILDSDRIDVAANHVKVSTLRAAVPFNEDLILFSDLTQFKLSGSDLLTPKTVSIKPQTEFENTSDTAPPVGVGKVIYFGVDRGSNTGLREYQLLPVTGTADAPEVTAHVPSYIPSNVFKIAATNTEEFLVMLSPDTRNRMYVYKSIWNNTTKVLSSWGRWILPASDRILGVDFIDTRMYAVINRPDGLYLDYLDLQIAATTGNFPYQIYLDRLVSVTGSYNSGLDVTTWTLPYPEDADLQLVLADSFATPGRMLNITRPTSTTVRAKGNYSAGPVYIGRTYTSRYRFSHQYVREARDGGSQAVTEGRLQLNRFSVNYATSGYFRAEVTPEARDTSTYVFSGYTLGDQDSVLGTRPLDSGTFKFPVLSNAATVRIEIINDSFLPSSLQQAGWEGKYYMRSQRVS